MKLFLLNVQMYDYEETGLDTEVVSSIHSSFERARKAGISELSRKFTEVEGMLEIRRDKLLADEKIDYSFTITEIDNLEYTENFNVNYDLFNLDEYLKLEPTHKKYYLDYKGNIEDIMYEYRIENLVWKCKKSITIYPEDLEEGASEKFKIGDIVKLKHDIDYGYIDDNTDRIYVVRWLPRKFNGEKYFENKYALISLYENDLKKKLKNEWGNKELFTFEYWERDIEKYTGVIEKDSEYDLLSRILKGNLKTRRDYWNKVKVGMLPLNIDSFREENLEDEDDWGFYSSTISPRRTELKVNIFPEKNEFGSNIKDFLPKIRVQNKIDDYQDTFSITLEENPRVVIGENKLSEEDYKMVCDFVRKNLDLLLKHFDSDNEFDEEELWNALKENGSIKKKKED